MSDRLDHPTLERRAALHQALGDPHRLAIVDALAFGDRSPSELAAALDIRSNLLAHHLQTLSHAGLIDTLHSGGDRRRRYVTLRRDALDELHLPPAPQPSLVLFVCSANSARSPIAAALWRRQSAVPAASAGTHPAQQTHPLAIEAAARAGLDIAADTPRAIDAIEARPDLLITVCDEANEELPNLGDVPRLHWSVPDPVPLGNAEAFEQAVDTLTRRIEALTPRQPDHTNQ
jgi:protein-tyrosine-phosphatase